MVVLVLVCFRGRRSAQSTLEQLAPRAQALFSPLEFLHVGVDAGEEGGEFGREGGEEGGAEGEEGAGGEEGEVL